MSARGPAVDGRRRADAAPDAGVRRAVRGRARVLHGRGTVLPGRVAVRGRAARRADSIGVGIAHRRVRDRGPAPPARRRLGVGSVRAPAAAPRSAASSRVVALLAAPRRDVARRCSSSSGRCSGSARRFFFVAALAADQRPRATEDAAARRSTSGRCRSYLGLADRPVHRRDDPRRSAGSMPSGSRRPRWPSWRPSCRLLVPGDGADDRSRHGDGPRPRGRRSSTRPGSSRGS